MTFQILLPRYIDVMMPKARVAYSGKFKLAAFKPSIGRVVRETPWFSNIILDSGLNRWGTGAIISGAGLGTDSTVPAAGQTSLLAPATFTTTQTPSGFSTLAAGASPYNNSRIFGYRTALGALNGSYVEVGVGWSSSEYFSRALILDGGGLPTSFPVAVDEQVDIYYQLDQYPSLVDFTDTVMVSGVSTDVTGRACNVNSVSGFGWLPPYAGAITLGSMSNNASVWNNVIGAITDTNPTGTSASGSLTLNTATYVSSSLERTGSITHGPTAGNVSGGIVSTRCVWATSGSTAGMTFQYEWDPVIAKDATKTLVLNYGVGWARR